MSLSDALVDLIVNYQWTGGKMGSRREDEDVRLDPVALKNGKLLCDLVTESLAHSAQGSALGLSHVQMAEYFSKGNAAEAFLLFITYVTSYLAWCTEHHRVATTFSGRNSSDANDFEAFFEKLYGSSGGSIHSRALHNRFSLYIDRFFPPEQAWRQPTLIASLNALAELLWDLQQQAHGHSALLLCPVCYAFACDNLVAAECFWCLLHYHCVCSSAGHSNRDAALHRHAAAAGRVAVRNGSAATLQRLCQVWLSFSGGSGSSSSEKLSRRLVSVGPSHQMSKLLLANLLAHDEAAAVATGAAQQNLLGETPLSLSLATLFLSQAPVEISPMALLREGYDAIRPSSLSSASLSDTALRQLRRQTHLFVSLLCTTPLWWLSSEAQSGDVAATFLSWAAQRGYVRLFRWVLEVFRGVALESETESDLCVIALSPDKEHTEGGEEEGGRKGSVTAAVKSVASPSSYRATWEVAATTAEDKTSTALVNTATATAPTAGTVAAAASGSTAVAEGSLALSKFQVEGFRSSLKMIRFPLIDGVSLSVATRSRCEGIVRLCLLHGASPYSLFLPTHTSAVGAFSGANDAVEGERTMWDMLLSTPQFLEAAAVGTSAGSPSGNSSLKHQLDLTLCRSVAAEKLAVMAWRLWEEKVRLVPAPLALTEFSNGRASSISNNNSGGGGSSGTEAEAYVSGHDKVLRLALAALQYDPHQPWARLALISVLCQKLRDWIQHLLPSLALCDALPPAETRFWVLYYSAVLRMYSQLTTTAQWERLLGGIERLKATLHAVEADWRAKLDADGEGKGDDDDDEAKERGAAAPAATAATVTKDELRGALPHCEAWESAERLSRAAEWVRTQCVHRDSEMGQHEEEYAAHADRLLRRSSGDRGSCSHDNQDGDNNSFFLYSKENPAVATHALVSLASPSCLFPALRESPYGVGRLLLLWRQVLLPAGTASRVWVRLPPRVDLAATLAAHGGAYGTVESETPLNCPVQRGDLVVFRRCGGNEGGGPFVAAQAFSGRDSCQCAQAVRLPACLLSSDDGDEEVLRELRCASIPLVHRAQENQNPLQWLQVVGSAPARIGVADALSALAYSQELTSLWASVAHLWSVPFWVHRADVAAKNEQKGETGAVAAALLHTALQKGLPSPGRALVVAKAEFPFPVSVESGAALGSAVNGSDPFAGCGSDAGALFLLSSGGVGGSVVVGVLPSLSGV